MLAWTGFQVLQVLGGDGTGQSAVGAARITDSAVPIGAILFVIAEALRLPQVLRDARGKGFVDAELIEAMSHGAPDARDSGA